MVSILGLFAVAALVFLVFRGCSPGALGGSPSIPQTGSDARQGRLGAAFVAASVDENGCPLDAASRLAGSNSIFAGFDRSDIPRGTSIFARLSREGQALEDTREIRADRDVSSCVWFEFQPGRAGFRPGSYAVDFFINGNRADQVQFVVDEGAARPASRPSIMDEPRLGSLYAASMVDNNGCPMNDTSTFRYGDPVYVAYEESVIPAGTELFARLLYDGRPVEDTRPIRADQNLRSCIWFSFEPERGADGLEPGFYEAQIFVNGSVADQIQFTIR
jgi:hypothetical protein